MTSYVTTIEGKNTLVELSDDGVCIVDGHRVHADLRQAGQLGYSILLDGESYMFLVEHVGGKWEVSLRGVPHSVNVETERQRLLKAYSSAANTGQKAMAVAAPMPAMVVRVTVKVGDAIAAGDGLMVLEAMKMENEIRAPNAGRVKEVLAKAGQAVEKGEILLLLE